MLKLLILAGCGSVLAIGLAAGEPRAFFAGGFATAAVTASYMNKKAA